VHLVEVEVVSAAPPSRMSLCRTTTTSSRHLNNVSCPHSLMKGH
jgi:hypothetical protein